MITNQIHHFKKFYLITDSNFYVMCIVSRGYRISQTSPSPPVFISFLGFQNIYVGCICTSKIVDTRPDLSCSRGGAPLPAPHHSPITHRSTPLLHALRSRDRHESLLQLRFPSSSQSLFVIFFFFFFLITRCFVSAFGSFRIGNGAWSWFLWDFAAQLCRRCAVWR